MTKIPGRVLAWAALLVALGASVLANVAYARPAVGPRLSAATAPLLVVLAAGLLERVQLSGARWWQRTLVIGGLVFVVFCAFVTSYQHQNGLLRDYGNPALSCTLLPLAVDALTIMASVCLAVIAERRRGLAQPTPEPETVEIVAEPVSDTVTDTTPVPDQPKRQRRPLTTAERIKRLRDRQPDVTASVAAKRLGITERTAQRHLTALAAANLASVSQ